jgi:hypothetical protein
VAEFFWVIGGVELVGWGGGIWIEEVVGCKERLGREGRGSSGEDELDVRTEDLLDEGGEEGVMGAGKEDSIDGGCAE